MIEIYIKPISRRGRLVVIPNLQRLGNILSKPALRFSMKTVLPSKYRRAALGFTLKDYEEGVLYVQEEDAQVNNKKRRDLLFKAVWELIQSVDGTVEDVEVKLK